MVSITLKYHVSVLYNQNSSDGNKLGKNYFWALSRGAL